MLPYPTIKYSYIQQPNQITVIVEKYLIQIYDQPEITNVLPIFQCEISVTNHLNDLGTSDIYLTINKFTLQYHIRESENDEYIHVISFECCTRLLGLVVTSKVKDNITRLYSNEKSEIIFYMRYISIELWADRYFLTYLPHDFIAELQVR